MDHQLTIQPLSVVVDGTHMASYRSGIFTNCGTYTTLFGLLVSGSDSEYKLKMSWGTTWGEAGYIRFYRFSNPCSLCTVPVYPVLWSIIVKYL